MRGNVAALVVLSFLVAAGFSAINLLVPYYILALGGELREIPEKLASVNAKEAALEFGAMTAAFTAMRSIFAAASGWLSDRLGRKPMILVGSLLYTAAGVAYYFAKSVPVLILLRSVQGVASALVWPVAEALLVDSVPPTVRTRALSLYVVSFNVGNVAGPLLGSTAYEASKRLLGETASVVDVLRVPFLIIAAALVLGLAATASVREVVTRGEAAPGRSREPLDGWSGSLREVPREVRRALAGFYANALLDGVAVGIVSSVLIIYIIDFIVKDPTKVGSLIAVPGLVSLLFAYPVARLLDPLPSSTKKWVLVGVIVFSRTLMMFLGFVRSVISFLAVVLPINMVINVVLPLNRSLEAEIVPARLRGRVFGLHQAFFNTGMVVGPLMGAWIYKTFYSIDAVAGLTGPQLVFVLAGLLGLAGAPLLAVLYSPSRVEKAWAALLGKPSRGEPHLAARYSDAMDETA
ncbi:MAG: MFS transporter [Thermoproteota archaeon]